MAYKIDDIEGIGQGFKDKLAQASIATTEDLLRSCANPAGRDDTASKTGLSTKQLLTWTNMADLMRVSGIGPQFAELLKAAGVDTVKELRTRNPENLAAKMAEINETRKLTRSVATSAIIQGWVEQAKTLDARIQY